MSEQNSDKVQIGIYQLDQTFFELNSTFSDIVGSIISEYNKKAKSEDHFKAENIVDLEDKNFKIQIFFASKSRIPKWRPFLEGILPDNSNLLKGQNIDASFIGFIEYDGNIFAISGGQGNFTVQEYINPNFGMEVLTRLIQKDSKVIKSLQDRGVTGSVLGSTKFFRGDQKLTDEDQFGKIYKLIKASLSKDILLSQFGFPEEDLRKSAGCLAKSSFQINKAISFDDLLRIIKKISEILKLEPNFPVNKVILITNRGKNNKELIQKLNKKLTEDLYVKYISGEETEFDFCHRDFEKYLMADKHVLMIRWDASLSNEDSELVNLSEVFRILKGTKKIPEDDITLFTDCLNHLTVKSFDTDGNILTKGSLFEHIHGEVGFEGKSYFLLDGSWYEIKDSFINDLNEELKEIVNQYLDSDLITEPYVISEIENSFNRKFIGKAGHLVLDKVIHNNIELCDIVICSEGEVNLVHVKRGFTNSIRELTSQIIISAKCLLADTKTAFKYVSSLEEKIRGLSDSEDDYLKAVASQVFPEGSLRKMFQGRGKRPHINFCLAFVDEAGTPRDIKDIKLFKSNIAKFSILELVKDLRKEGFNFKLIQLKPVSIKE